MRPLAMTWKARHAALLPALALLLPSCALGPPEIGLIALIVLVLFGGSQLPKLMRGMGSGINEFKKGLKEGENDEDDEEGDGDGAKRADASEDDDEAPRGS